MAAMIRRKRAPRKRKILCCILGSPPKELIGGIMVFLGVVSRETIELGTLRGSFWISVQIRTSVGLI